MPDILNSEFVKLKGYIDLCSSNLTQLIAARYYKDHIDNILPAINKNYKKQSYAMIKAIDDNMSVERTTPTGGFFVWVKLKGIDIRKLLKRAIENDMIFVPGESFFPNKNYQLNPNMSNIIPTITEKNYLRLSYTKRNCENVSDGIKILSKLV